MRNTCQCVFVAREHAPLDDRHAARTDADDGALSGVPRPSTLDHVLVSRGHTPGNNSKPHGLVARLR